jgi:hypothetical protein
MKNTEKTYKTKKEIRGFFRSQGIVYLQRTKVTWNPLHSKKLDQRDYYKENEDEFRDIHHRYAGKIERCHMAPIYIKEITHDIGFGVFAADNIKKNEFIGEYAGVVQVPCENSGEETCNGYESDFSWYYLDEIDDGTVLEINGRLEGNEMRFVNHGSEPNVDVEHMLYKGQWVIFFKAARRILKDEQLLISYGEDYWNDGYRDLVDL